MSFLFGVFCGLAIGGLAGWVGAAMVWRNGR